MFINKMYRLVDDGDVVYVLKPGEPMAYRGSIIAVSNSLDGIDAAMREYQGF